jgi:hypothetical protein
MSEVDELREQVRALSAELAALEATLQLIADGRWNVGRTHSLQTAPEFAKWELRRARAEEGAP